jgi:hypothetical protein
LKGQVVPSLSATCKGYSESLECLSVQLGSRGRISTVRFSCPLSYLLIQSGALDLSESWLLDRSNSLDVGGVACVCTDVSVGNFSINRERRDF